MSKLLKSCEVYSKITLNINCLGRLLTALFAVIVFSAPSAASAADCPCFGPIIITPSSPSFEDFEAHDPTDCGIDGLGCSQSCSLLPSSPWTNILNSGANGDQLDWTIHSGGTASSGTGPQFDATTGSVNGVYAYVESSCTDIGYPNRKAILATSKCFDFRQITAPRLSFYYHMAGESTGDLFVEARSTDNCDAWQVVDVIRGPQQSGESSAWKRRVTNLFGFVNQARVRIRFRAQTGNYFLSDIAIDDITVQQAPSVDVAVSEITGPISKCGMSNSETVRVKVENLGSQDRTNIPVSYSIDGGPAVNEVIPGPLPAGSSIVYDFTTPANLSASGTHSVHVAAQVAGDADSSNDSVTTSVQSVPTITTFPYTQNFEAGEGGWLAEGNKSTWAYGTPDPFKPDPEGPTDHPVINSAASGTKAWVTGGLAGAYFDLEDSRLLSPCFNFSNLKLPIITFKSWWSSEGGQDGLIDGFDGTVLQSTIDNGTSWQTIGTNTEPANANWYTAQHLASNPGNQTNSGGKIYAWTGSFASDGGGSDEWVNSSNALRTSTGNLAGQSSVRLRFGFASDDQVRDAGFGVDDVTVREGFAATKTQVFELDANNNGRADPNDIIKYTVVLTNQSGRNITNVTFNDNPDPSTTLLTTPGSVTTTAGSVTFGTNPKLRVTLGTMQADVSATITFKVKVNPPTATCVAQVCNQGSVTGVLVGPLFTVLTDDPSVGGLSDMTCVAADEDSDGDGVFNCLDRCPGFNDNQNADGDFLPDGCDGCLNDPNKWIQGNGLGQAPGQCGCGVADVDGDGDGTASCIDGCPTDINKTQPGQCGCNVPDTDSDNDGVANCNDPCPNNSAKFVPGTGFGQAPGQCGCNVNDVDSDGDNTADCIDSCPTDVNKIQPGQCGCGVADTDSDSDGVADCNDPCPTNPTKFAPGTGLGQAPGQCGCNVNDVDTDGDNTADCIDSCPTDINKTQAGQCGCNVADTDSDNDGVADCNDPCPNNPTKNMAGTGFGQAPGQCGCSVNDVDSDGDNVADCIDACPLDPNKSTPGTGAGQAPGQCGCGVADTDSDNDSIPDCLDDCPGNPDSDNDGVFDCFDGCPTDPNKATPTGNGFGQAPGQCGCFNPDLDPDGDQLASCIDPCPNNPNNGDTDNDGFADCVDVCPNDPLKHSSAGQCGCGVAETDSDGDGVANCNDPCPTNGTKFVPGTGLGQAPGQCGCNVNDVDSDGDTTADCIDQCPNNPSKTQPGQCGCNTPDTDTDGDGVANCNDPCPNNSTKFTPGTGLGQAPGQCGCNVNDVDTDGDNSADCIDLCPLDSNKLLPGVCGCGTADTDSDGDGVPNCNDGCANDPTKTQPGQCGCGVVDTDNDNDGTANCNDACPNDPNKEIPGTGLGQAPGQCGCGNLDTDTDNDSTADCIDGCPVDPSKITPGLCGCNVTDTTDSDGDGTVDCDDVCPLDPLKITSEGQCGCNVADTDNDGDGTANCNDPCQNDPNKEDPGSNQGQAPGICGCGVADIDSDGDGTLDCQDACPLDANKKVSGPSFGQAPGLCGCGVADVDADADGRVDCQDSCASDPSKVAPGICGCNVPDTDSDGDGVANCAEQCPQNSAKVSAGACGCNSPDTDSNNNGIADCVEPPVVVNADACPADPLKVSAGICGCGTADTDINANGITDCFIVPDLKKQLLDLQANVKKLKPFKGKKGVQVDLRTKVKGSNNFLANFATVNSSKIVLVQKTKKPKTLSKFLSPITKAVNKAIKLKEKKALKDAIKAATKAISELNKVVQ